jgi:hypothetical protein
MMVFTVFKQTQAFAASFHCMSGDKQAHPIEEPAIALPFGIFEQDTH